MTLRRLAANLSPVEAQRVIYLTRWSSERAVEEAAESGMENQLL